MDPGYPSLQDPWTFGSKKKAKPAPPPPAPTETQTQPSQVPASEAQTPGPEATPQTVPAATGKTLQNEISASGDYFFGQGKVTLPFGFALANKFNQLPNLELKGTVNDADRSSDYFGGTVSYGAFGQALYLDLAYAHGTSSGEVPVHFGSSTYQTYPSAFSINDDWYQAYIRYTFPSLRGKKFSAYLRGGVSFVQANLTDNAPLPQFGVYSEKDKTEDLLGNLGFGVSYFLHRWGHLRLWVQMEGEGFYGRRSQDISESFPNNPGIVLSPVTINNDVYGGIGRGTLRLDYRIGSSGAFNAFSDVGIQAKYSIINYSGLGNFDELLWGPYVKVGIRYSF